MWEIKLHQGIYNRNLYIILYNCIYSTKQFIKLNYFLLFRFFNSLFVLQHIWKYMKRYKFMWGVYMDFELSYQISCIRVTLCLHLFPGVDIRLCDAKAPFPSLYSQFPQTIANIWRPNYWLQPYVYIMLNWEACSDSNSYMYRTNNIRGIVYLYSITYIFILK